jgi:predicted TPR repeat methyltransferase
LTQNSIPAFRSSGDLLADRRYAYAKAAVEAEDYAEAADILQQVLELVPHWAPALFMLGIAEDKLMHREEAIRALESAAALDIRDELGASLHLARLGARPAPRTAAEAYVQKLFDQYAVHFEKHLLGMLAYRAPALLLETVLAIRSGPFAHVLDLGCGTGLCGAAFRVHAQRLSGADLSPGMIEEARAKAIYDRLDVASLDTFLAAEAPESADLVLAADVFVYIGDLAPVFSGAARVLKPEGLFAFTVQRTPAEHKHEGFVLGPDLRFAHAPAYIEEQLRKAGLRVITMESAVTRQDGGQDVEGLAVAAGRA